MPPKVATRSSLEQVAIIDWMLARNAGATLEDLCERLDCHPKTVIRHMKWMQNKFDLRIDRVGDGVSLSARFIYPLGQSRIFTKEACRKLAAASPY